MAQVTLSNGRGFNAGPEMSILDAATRAGLVLEHSCRTGRCGTCKARVVAGNTNALLAEDALGADERAAAWILTCARAAVSDVELDIEDLSGLAGIQVKTLPCRIDTIERPAPDVAIVTLRLPPSSSFIFRAGQYIDVMGPGGLTRSYSVASAPAAPTLELHVREVPGGALSRYWFGAAKSDDLLRFRGPIGTFFLRDVAGMDLVFLATGTGFAPVKSMLSELATLPAGQAPASVSLYWGGRKPADLYFDARAALPVLRHHPVLSKGPADWPGARGHVQDVLRAHAPDIDRMVVYACGSAAMIKSAQNTLDSMGLQAGRFRSDAFVSSS